MTDPDSPDDKPTAAPSSAAPQGNESEPANQADGAAPSETGEAERLPSSGATAPGDPSANESLPPSGPSDEGGEQNAVVLADKASQAGAPSSPTVLPALLRQVGWSPPLLQTAVVLSLAMVGASATLVAFNTKTSAVNNTNVGSRYGQVEGLVNHGTYAITKTKYRRTIDKVQFKGEDISSKPPLLPTVTAGLYWAFRGVTGYDIRTDERKVVGFCNVMMGAVLHLIMLLFWLRFLLLVTQRPETVILAAGTFAFGFLAVGYAIELNNHSVAACLTTVGFYYAYRIRNELDARPWHWGLSGFLLGILPAVDVPSALTSAGVFLYLASYDWRQTLTRWVPFAIWGPLLAMFLNYQVTESILPVQLQPELKEGTYWKKRVGIDALNENKFIYGFNLLLGHHGLFSMTPVLALGLSFFVRNLLRRERWVPETLLIGGVCSALFAFYLLRTRNYGGNCVGFRWAIAWTPLLFALVAFYLASIRLQAQHVIIVVAATGLTMFHNWEIFTWTAWHTSGWEMFIRVIFPTWLVGDPV